MVKPMDGKLPFQHRYTEILRRLSQERDTTQNVGQWQSRVGTEL